ncbi:hypothetical protein [Nocardioides sp. GY 10127]|uniref:hypothetical protein n=1 Tax=Nocardioides sp. GY 10127 TaxID=2569762 RepID=UPI0010A7DDA0|nr:hypothetical protein [Nocardioides sp. GY 10127]TIC85559.1 hypothetical protein E8D37_02725 [Nocardioides sp. GY 10127]
MSAPARGTGGRVVLGAVGVVVLGYGLWLLVSRQSLEGLVDVGVWWAVGVLAHDVVLSGLLVLLGAAGARLLPPAWRAPVAGGLVVLGALTLLAVPVLVGLGREHAPDNPTLLDRDYWAGWGVLAALTAVGVVVARYLPRRRGRG